jgi:hypothetical protein
MFLPQGMQDWSRKINKYLMDNLDKIWLVVDDIMYFESRPTYI